MRHILKKYQKVHIRPIIYYCVSRGSISLTAAFVWDRFWGGKSYLSVARDIFFLVGLVFLGIAWVHYLRLDGINPKIKEEVEATRIFKKKKPMRFSYGDIIDFADEKVVTMDELSDEEQHLCKLAANLILGGVFILISFIFI